MELELEAWRARRSGEGPRVGRGWTWEKGKLGAVLEGRTGRSEDVVGVRRAARAASVRGRRREGIVGVVWVGVCLFVAIVQGSRWARRSWGSGSPLPSQFLHSKRKRRCREATAGKLPRHAQRSQKHKRSSQHSTREEADASGITNTSSQRNREAKTRAGWALEPSYPNDPGLARPQVGPCSESSTGASGRGQSRGAGMR